MTDIKKYTHTITHELVFTEEDKNHILQEFYKINYLNAKLSIDVDDTDNITKMKIEAETGSHLARGCYLLGGIVGEVLKKMNATLKTK